MARASCQTCPRHLQICRRGLAIARGLQAVHGCSGCQKVDCQASHQKASQTKKTELPVSLVQVNAKTILQALKDVKLQKVHTEKESYWEAELLHYGSAKWTFASD